MVGVAVMEGVGVFVFVADVVCVWDGVFVMDLLADAVPVLDVVCDGESVLLDV
jgi:hypothetical protein